MQYDCITLITNIVLTGFVLILIPVYWKYYGPQNFLWLSDISLFLTLAAVWLQSPLINSIVLLMALPFEIAWNFDFFFQLITGKNLLKLAAYMFETKYTYFLKSLSFFHIILPIIWITNLYYWGYNVQALKYVVALTIIVVLLTYFFTSPEKNINWVFAPKAMNWTWIEIPSWLILLITVYLVLLCIPLHFFLIAYFT